MLNYKPGDVEWPETEICMNCGRISNQKQYSQYLMVYQFPNGERNESTVYLCPKCNEKIKHYIKENKNVQE